MTSSTAKFQWEHERKWLVKTIPENTIKRLHKQNIEQGYVAYTKNFSLRVRHVHCDDMDFFSLTIKKGKGQSRSEFEVPLDSKSFNALWPKASDRLTKTRYSWSEEGVNKFDLDIYHGSLEGLVTIEVEFVLANFAKSFKPLDWFGKEVTKNSAYTNAMLAAKGLP